MSALPEPLPPESDDSGEARDDRGLFGAALALIRSEFEPRTWQAFWLTAVEGRPPDEVSSELKMSPGAVRVAKSRVLRRLREELGES
jgi:RNA polymerase sigma-70 factor (ECF subfamily)